MQVRLSCLLLAIVSSLVSSVVQAESDPRLRLETELVSRAADDVDSPIFIDADRLHMDKQGKLQASGQVRIRKRGQSVQADEVLYQRQSQQLEAAGDVRLQQNQNLIFGEQLQLNLQSQSGQVTQPGFQLLDTGGRGQARQLTIQDKQHYSLDDATYTTCRPDDESWLLQAGELEIDRQRHVGVARHVRVKFQGIPLIYAPWMSFALNDQRRSGLLAPTFGSTEKGGAEITVPYYWNIAPHRDATLSPRVMEKRGVLFNNEFRYLDAQYRGQLNLDILPWDRVAERRRGRVTLQHQHQLPWGGSAYLNLNRVSDNDYYRDLADQVNATSQVNLPQEAGLHYARSGWQARAMFQQFQTLQDESAPIQAPYTRLPQLTLSGEKYFNRWAASLTSEYVDFGHEQRVNGQRFVVNPAVRYDMFDHPAYYLRPELALHSTVYQIGDNNQGQFEDQSRHVPIFSVDAGAEFERRFDVLGRPQLQTLEPRIFYVYAPYRQQAQLPNFDTAQADFSFAQMFSKNRFFGHDRVGDANQVTLAMTTRILDEQTGRERLQVKAGQRFSIKSPRVFLHRPDDADHNRSDMLVAASGPVTDAWSLQGELQYDPNDSQMQRYNAAAHYRPEPGKVLNLGYRFSRNSFRHVDVSGQWPLSAKWQAVGRWNYSLQDDELLEAILGLEYVRHCWSMRLVAQKFATSSNEDNTSFFMQLQLNDLMRIGSDPLGLLKDSIAGYRVTGED